MSDLKVGDKSPEYLASAPQWHGVLLIENTNQKESISVKSSISPHLVLLFPSMARSPAVARHCELINAPAGCTLLATIRGANDVFCVRRLGGENE